MREAYYDGPVHPIVPQIRLNWNLEGDSALATFFADERMITTSGLCVSGDAALIHLAEIINGTTGVDMRITLQDRPVIVSIPWPSTDAEALMLVADMETCLAAAYFDPALVRNLTART